MFSRLFPCSGLLYLTLSLKLPPADFGLEQGLRLGLGLNYLLKAALNGVFRVINKPATAQDPV